MQHRSSPSAGFSLIELLVVIAIIGTLSLISVPAFMNFQRQNQIRTAMSVLSTDLRAARATAIRSQRDVMIEFQPSLTDLDTARQYNFFSSTDGGTTWSEMNIRATPYKRLERPVWIESATNFDDADDDDLPDVVFHPDGTADLLDDPNVVEARLVLFIPNGEELRSNRYNITIRRSGIVRGLSSQCSDQIDNDLDGKKDKQPPTSTDIADPDCASTQDNDESA